MCVLFLLQFLSKSLMFVFPFGRGAFRSEEDEEEDGEGGSAS